MLLKTALILGDFCRKVKGWRVGEKADKNISSTLNLQDGGGRKPGKRTEHLNSGVEPHRYPFVLAVSEK